MNTKLLLLLALCFMLTACGRRNQNNEATQPPATVVLEQPTTAMTETIAIAQPATDVPQPTLELTLAPTQPAATEALPTPTVAAQPDPLGDELDAMLGQLEATNSASDQEVNNLDVP